MKLIMLDIDGVLVTAQCRELPRSMQQPWPRCVQRLNELLAATGASIVVSSVWRIGRTVEELQELLSSWGVQGAVIGKTGRSDDGERGDEIKTWLAGYILDHPTRPIDFIVIDDDNDMGDVLPRLIRTSFQHGLSRRHVRAAIKLLGRKDE